MEFSGDKFIAIMGGFGHEGLSAHIETLGFRQNRIVLDGVTPRTWLKRATLLESIHKNGALAATIVHFHSTLLLQASRPEYREALQKSLTRFVARN
jgi:hypothetical protein